MRQHLQLLESDMGNFRKGLFFQQTIALFLMSSCDVKRKLQSIYMVHLPWVWWPVCNLMELPCYPTLLVVDSTVFARGCIFAPQTLEAPQSTPPSQHIVSILFSWTMRNVRNYCFYFRIFFHYRIWELAKCSLALLIHQYSCTWFDFSNQKKIKPRVKNDWELWDILRKENCNKVSSKF